MIRILGKKVLKLYIKFFLSTNIIPFENDPRILICDFFSKYKSKSWAKFGVGLNSKKSLVFSIFSEKAGVAPAKANLRSEKSIRFSNLKKVTMSMMYSH